MSKVNFSKDLSAIKDNDKAALKKIHSYALNRKTFFSLSKLIKIGAVDAIIMFTFLMADTTRPHFTALDLFITWLSALALVTFMLALIRHQSRRAKSHLAHD